MSIKSMMAAFAALIIAGRATAADTPLPITNITVNAGSVTLKWAPPLNRTPDDLRLEESSDLVNWDVVDNVKAPKNIDGTSVSVGADTKKFFRLYAADASGGDYPYPYTPDPEITWTERVGHTIVINLTNDFKVTRLPADFCVTNDPGSKTDHLYLRYITKTPDGTPDQMGALVTEVNMSGKTNLNLSGYYIGVYTVTEAQYVHVMGDYPEGLITLPSFRLGDDRPVRFVDYYDIRGEDDPATAPSSTSFPWTLSNEVYKANGISLAFDLPTEAQWEVACRAGTIGSFNNTSNALPSVVNATWTNIVNEVAWWAGNNNQAPYGNDAKPVGLKRANRAGLYDMHGNVSEWCRDSYFAGTYRAVDGGDQPVLGGSNRSLRGSNYNDASTASSLRSGYRITPSAQNRRATIGFRICARGDEVPAP